MHWPLFRVECYIWCSISPFNTDLLPIQDARAASLALGVGQEERFFNKLEDDVIRIIQQEKRREQYANSQGQEVNTSTEHEPVSRPGETHIPEQAVHPAVCYASGIYITWMSLARIVEFNLTFILYAAVSINLL